MSSKSFTRQEFQCLLSRLSSLAKVLCDSGEWVIIGTLGEFDVQITSSSMGITVRAKKARVVDIFTEVGVVEDDVFSLESLHAWYREKTRHWREEMQTLFWTEIEHAVQEAQDWGRVLCEER